VRLSVPRRAALEARCSVTPAEELLLVRLAGRRQVRRAG
jgi:hypothetical protein